MRENPTREISVKKIKPFGCLVSVRKTTKSKYDFEAKSFLGIHLGMAKNHSFRTYWFLNLETGRIVAARSAKFYSDKFPGNHTDHITLRQHLLNGTSECQDISKYTAVTNQFRNIV